MLRKLWPLLGALVLLIGLPAYGEETVDTSKEEPVVEKTLDQTIDEGFGKLTGPFVSKVFSEIQINGYGVKWVIVWLALAGLILTITFKFVNLRAFPLAIKTVKGRYSSDSDPGEISHFQALTAAVSGTVGLGNIAGVAIGISIAGPGVAFWLFLAGFLGMATKFAECTLGVKYREIDSKGRIHGGGMHYLKKGLAERGMPGLGQVLAIFFAVFCVFASFGGGNIFQVSQVTQQLINVTGGEEKSFFVGNQWIFGVTMAAITALVILGGIQGIAKVTSKLVPTMCLIYIASALVVLIV
ncbi:alanine:cation symporter family protein, partial [Akkermansiaceae bacterium]|nr:alanine:cation symporter family protein [Akkermansiaceae bacterium]